MNELESQVEVAGDGTSLREQLKVLRTLLAVCLVMLIGLAVGADYVLSKQIQIVRDQSRPSPPCLLLVHGSHARISWRWKAT